MKNQQLIVEVSFEDIVLQVRPHQEYEWLLTTKEVAEGYGVSKNAVQKHFQRNPEEFIQNKHFVTMDNLSIVGAKSNQLFWTKRGVIRLGFFIKSERAKLFRDWAEDLILNHLEKQNKAYVTESRLQEVLEKNNKELIGVMNELTSAVHSLANKKFTQLNARLELLEAQFEAYFSARAQLDSTSKVAYVYVFHKLGTNEYKIGKSIDPLARKSHFEQSGIKLDFVVSIKCKSSELALAWEKILQRTFKSSHLRGEWYLLSKPELSFLLELAKAKEILD